MSPVPEAESKKKSGLSFGQALDALESGSKVAREGWNGKGMWLSLSCNAGRPVAAENFWSPHNAEHAREMGGTALVLPCVTMKTVRNEIMMGWVPTQTDMFAKDWLLVE